MERYITCSQNRRQYSKKSILPSWSTDSMQSQWKSQQTFCRNQQEFNNIEKCKGPRIAKIIWGGKKAGGLPLCDSKAWVETDWNMHQQNRRDSKTDLHIFTWLSEFQQQCQVNSMGNVKSFQQMVLEKFNTIYQNMTLISISHHIRQLTRTGYRPNLRAKVIKFLRGKMRKIFGKYFSNTTQKSIHWMPVRVKTSALPKQTTD